MFTEELTLGSQSLDGAIKTTNFLKIPGESAAGQANILRTFFAFPRQFSALYSKSRDLFPGVPR